MIEQKPKCRKRVYSGSFIGRQCNRNAVKDGWCNQHHPDLVRARQDERYKKYKEKQKTEPWYLLQEANKKIQELEAEIAKLKDKEER